MISYVITDDSTQVLFTRTVNSGVEVLEMIKPLVINVSGANKINVRDSASQSLDLLWTEVSTPSSTDIADLESQLLAFNNTAPSGGGGGSRLIASLENVDLGGIAEVLEIPFASGKTVLNTIPTNYIIERVNDTDTFSLQTVEVLTAGANGNTLDCISLGISVVQDGSMSVSDLATELVNQMNGVHIGMFSNVGGVIYATTAYLTTIGNTSGFITSTGSITLDGEQFYSYALIRQDTTGLFNTNVMQMVGVLNSISKKTGQFYESGIAIPGTSTYNIQKQVALKNQFLVNIYIYGDTI